MMAPATARPALRHATAPVRARHGGAARVRHVAERADRGAHGRRLLRAVGAGEDLIHYLLASVILATGMVVLVHSVADFALSEDHVALRTTAALNGVLVVVIVMELLRTVLGHFDDAGLQLKPFLVIGVIATLRHVLTAGAELSLGGATSGGFRDLGIMLGVSASVALLVVAALVLVRSSEGTAPPPSGPGAR